MAVPTYTNDWLAAQKAGKTGYSRTVVPHITCKDGTALSVQASDAHYCSPKDDNGPWTSVEVWCIRAPSGRTVHPRSFGNGGRSDPYGWVPVEIVDKFIKRHGGLA